MLLIFFKLKKKKIYFVYVLRQLKTNREKTSYSFIVKKTITVIKENDFMVSFVV